MRNGRTCGNLSLSRALGDFEFKRNSAPSDLLDMFAPPLLCAPRSCAIGKELADNIVYINDFEVGYPDSCMGSARANRSYSLRQELHLGSTLSKVARALCCRLHGRVHCRRRQGLAADDYRDA